MSSPMDVLYELFAGLPRQGPGNNAATRRAWALLGTLPPRPAILDIGCGSGVQTLELARCGAGQVVALDNHMPFLAALQQQARAARLAARVAPVVCAMEALAFAPGSFDVIWSEGAIYIIGFAQGLRAWRPLLKPGGFLVVSHITWFTPEPAPELAQFWHEEQVEMRTAEEMMPLIEQAGYHCLAHFPLPQEAWWDGFYQLVEQRIAPLQQKYRHDPERLTIIHNQQREIDLYRTYADQYGYEFYVMQAR